MCGIYQDKLQFTMPPIERFLSPIDQYGKTEIPSGRFDLQHLCVAKMKFPNKSVRPCLTSSSIGKVDDA